MPWKKCCCVCEEIMISVIVPAYNIENYIGRTLDSILAQSFPELEIIVVNDGSQDDTGAVIDRYAAAYPHRILALHIPNGGVTNARLTGVAHARGEWIGFVDGDDVIEPDMYERLFDNAQKYHADISHCGYRMVFEDDRVNFFHNTGVTEVHSRTDALGELLRGSRIEPGLWNKLFRRDLFQGWKMDRTIRINEDLLMNFYLFSAAENAVYEDWCPYHYLVRSTSATRVRLNTHRIYDPIRVKEIIRQSAPAELAQEAQRAYLNTCIAVYHSLIVAGKEYGADAKAVRKLLAKERKAFLPLGKKRTLLVGLIVSLPAVYNPVYRLYCRFLQKNPYT